MTVFKDGGGGKKTQIFFNASMNVAVFIESAYTEVRSGSQDLIERVLQITHGAVDIVESV